MRKVWTLTNTHATKDHMNFQKIQCYCKTPFIVKIYFQMLQNTAGIGDNQEIYILDFMPRSKTSILSNILESKILTSRVLYEYSTKVQQCIMWFLNRLQWVSNIVAILTLAPCMIAAESSRNALLEHTLRVIKNLESSVRNMCFYVNKWVLNA